MATRAQARPLDDLVVVELGDALAGAYAGKLLAELGARVVRVDDLGGGNLYRAEPLAGSDAAGLKVSTTWLHLNRGKESVVCRLDSAGGREILDRLFAWTDVVIDGLGLDRLA